jgi:hypothetical protein
MNLVDENATFSPTYTRQQSQAREAAQPVRAEFELPEGFRQARGIRHREIGHLKSRNKLLEVADSSMELPEGNRARLEGAIQAPSRTKIMLKIMSQGGNSLSREVICRLHK